MVTDMMLLTPKGRALCKKYGVGYEQLMFMVVARAVDSEKVDLGDVYITLTGQGATWTKKYLKSKVDGIVSSPLMERVCEEMLAPAAPAPVKRPKKEDALDLTDKNVMLRELKALYERTEDIGDRLKITSQIADLQRMKKEEVKTEDDTIHYYLPLTCSECPLKAEYDAARNAAAEESAVEDVTDNTEEDVQEKKRRGRKPKEIREPED